MITNWKLPLIFDAARINAELHDLADSKWTPHFNTHQYAGDWSGIALRAPENAHMELYPDPTASSYVDTPYLEKCAYTRSVIDTFKCEKESARFLRLGAGAEIKLHRDYKLGFDDGVARIHIPVQTNRLIEFCVDGKLIEMKAGEAWYLNFNLFHSVKNPSDEDRVHLVIDLIVNDWLRGIFPAE